MTAARRFPPPWTVEALEECFIVRDAHEQALGYFYFDAEPHRRAVNKRLTKDDIWQWAGRQPRGVPACQPDYPNQRPGRL